ncbi:hypothetical protein ACJX0J_027123, partial [Zea mays]
MPMAFFLITLVAGTTLQCHIGIAAMVYDGNGQKMTKLACTKFWLVLAEMGYIQYYYSIYWALILTIGAREADNFHPFLYPKSDVLMLKYHKNNNFKEVKKLQILPSHLNNKGGLDKVSSDCWIWDPDKHHWYTRRTFLGSIFLPLNLVFHTILPCHFFSFKTLFTEHKFFTLLTPGRWQS